MRRTIRQAGAAVPVRIMMDSLTTQWQTVLSPPDFSVPDPQLRFPDSRDPLDNQRRIQPGFALVESPLMFHNSSLNPVVIEISILREDGTRIMQARINVTGEETYLHPAPGQRMLKMDHTTEDGDLLQVKASVANVVSLTGTASEGAAEQHEPEVV